jgi:hypothetical protein
MRNQSYLLENVSFWSLLLVMSKGIHLLTMGTINRFLVVNTFSMDEIKYA